MSKEYLYTEEVQLPSKGVLNPNIPEGKVTLRCVEVRDQKYLAGSKLVHSNKGVELLERCVIKPENFNVRELTQMDLFYLLVKLRILSYGSSYRFITTCPHCKAATEVECDLSQLRSYDLDEDYDKKLKVVLPKRGDTVYTHIQTQGDAEDIEKEVQRMRSKFKDLEGDPEVTLSIAKIISRVELKKASASGAKVLGSELDMLQYVETLMDIDALAIQSTVESIDYGIDPRVDVTCSSCGGNFVTFLRTSPEFFRPRYVG